MITEVKRGNTLTQSLDFVMEECCKCGIPFLMPTYHKKMLVADPGKPFYCPNGHCQSYVGKSEAQTLREQLEAERKKRVEEHEVLQNRWLDAVAERQKLQGQLKRVHKGTCPCCNRSFANVQKHMKTMHPETLKQP